MSLKRRLTWYTAQICCISLQDISQRPCWGSWRKTALCCIWSCYMASHTRRNRCLSPPGNLRRNKPEFISTFSTHSYDFDLNPSCDYVGVCMYRFLNYSDLMCSKPFSYQELGQHILCTARGCSRVHRLEHKEHELTSIFEVPTVICHRSIIDVTPIQHTESSVSYQACAPCGSCSCPPGSVFHSRCGRLWCCNYQRSLNPWPSPYSLPRAEADKSATTNTSRASHHFLQAWGGSSTVV